MHYKDLTPFTYWNEDMLPYTNWGNFIDKEILNVGWLEFSKSFNQGSSSSQFLDKLFQLCLSPFNKTRGFHDCDFCAKRKPFGLGKEVERNGQKVKLGNAEIKVEGLNGKIYATPDLIYHYVESHDYLPPQEFIDAVLSYK